MASVARNQIGTGERIYLTAAELAHQLQVDDKTVYRWAQTEPSMPGLRIGGVVRFPRERVLQWLANHEQGHSRRRRSRSVSADRHVTSQRAESAKSASTQGTG